MCLPRFAREPTQVHTAAELKRAQDRAHDIAKAAACRFPPKPGPQTNKPVVECLVGLGYVYENAGGKVTKGEASAFICWAHDRINSGTKEWLANNLKNHILAKRKQRKFKRPTYLPDRA